MLNIHPRLNWQDFFSLHFRREEGRNLCACCLKWKKTKSECAECAVSLTSKSVLKGGVGWGRRVGEGGDILSSWLLPPHLTGICEYTWMCMHNLLRSGTAGLPRHAVHLRNGTWNRSTDAHTPTCNLSLCLCRCYKEHCNGSSFSSSSIRWRRCLLFLLGDIWCQNVICTVLLVIFYRGSDFRDLGFNTWRK